MQLVIKIPDKNTPGYPRRIHRALSFQKRMKEEVSAELFEEMINFLAEYVEGDKTQAKESLWDCTEDQFNEIITAVLGGGASEVPPPKSAPIDTL